MHFIETYTEFAILFFPMLIAYLILRAFSALASLVVYHQRRHLSELEKNSALIERLNTSSYHTHLNYTSASFWRQCFEHLLSQSAYAQDKGRIMERADLALADYLGGFREHFKQNLEGSSVKSSDKEGLAKILNEMFPND